MYSINKAAAIFGQKGIKNQLEMLIDKKLIPTPEKFRSGAIFKKGWSLKNLPLIGEQIGYFPKFDSPTAISIFTTKGGVLKSTLALNLARTAALHNHKVCMVGLDIQGDITTALGYENSLSEVQNLNEVIELLDATKGLSDLFNSKLSLEALITPTDLENLCLIPETPELVALNDSLSNINRREYWLKEKVIEPLKKYFDLIIMDCSPNWNKLTTNALVAADILISPLECKINNFRNFRMFQHFIGEFKAEMNLGFETIYVPTKYCTNKKLSLEIKTWYEENLVNCTRNGIKESVLGEEAIALNKSMVEHAYNKPLAHEMIHLFQEIHSDILSLKNKTCDSFSSNKQFQRQAESKLESSWQ